MRAEDFLNGKVDSSGGLGSAEDFLGAVEPKKQNKGIMADIGTDIKRGIMSVPGAITGLADIPIAAVTGGAYANKAADVIGDITGFQPSKWAEDAKAEYSPERNAASQKVEQAWADNENPFSKAADGDLSGIGNIAKSYIQNPRHTVGQVVESVPSMLAGGLAGRGIAAVSKLSPIVGGAIGEGAIMAGQQMDQLSDTEADPRMAAAASLATGVVGAGIGAAGGKLAQRMGVVDPETALAGGAARGIAGEAADKTIKGAIADGAKRVAGGAASEGLFEELPQSVLEQALSNLAQGKDWSEGVDRAAIEGTLAGSLMGGAFNVLPPKQQEQQEKPPADDDKPDISGLLPSPTYTGTPNDQMLAAESERQAAIDKAQADADALYAMRDKFERDMATSFRGAPEIITDPAPIQQRIDALLGINQSRLSGVARSNYERAIENAFGEQIGFAVGNDGLEIPVTMADYIASKVAVGDIDRNSAIAARLSGDANQAADARLQQIADEEATVQPDIQAIKVVGPLSAAANVAVQTGAAAPVASRQPTEPPSEQPSMAGIMAGVTRSPEAPAITSAPDVTKRTDKQLGHLVTNGSTPEVRSAAKAEIAKRTSQKQAAAGVPAATTGDSRSAPVLSVGIAPNAAEPITVKNGVIHIGKYAAQDFDSGEDVTVPEGATPREIVDALKKSGAVAGKQKVFGLEKEAEAVPEDSTGWNKKDEAGRTEVLKKAGYGGANGRLNLAGVRLAKTPWESMSQAVRDKLVAADQNPIKNESPSAATVPAETVTPKQEPDKTYEQFKAEMQALLSHGYKPNEVGFGIHAEKMADLSDKYPEYSARLDAESDQPIKKADLPSVEAVSQPKTDTAPEAKQDKAPAINIGSRKAGDILEMQNGNRYRIEEVEGDKVRATRNPDQLNERSVLLGQDEFDKLAADDAETRKENAATAERVHAERAQTEASKPDEDTRFAKNTIFTADKVAAAKARMKAKLGTMNSGIDPELLIDGITVAGAYIESGVRKFSDYAKVMVADLGDGVKPYLLSFYEAARAYPGLDKAGMDSADSAAIQHQAMLTPEVKAAAKEVIGESPKVEKKKPANLGEALKLKQDWGVPSIDGYTRSKTGANQETDYGQKGGVKDEFLADATRYLKSVAKLLEAQGFTAQTNSKGKPMKAVSANEGSPAAGGDVSLVMRNGDFGIYAAVGVTNVRGIGPNHPQGVSLMVRTTTNADKDRYSTGTMNNWLATDLSSGDLSGWFDKQYQAFAKRGAEVKPAALSKAIYDLSKTDDKFKVATEIADFLIGGGEFKTIIEARKKISEMIGRPIDAATELAKQADETIEAAVVIAGREIVKAGRAQKRGAEVIYDRLVDLYRRQPNLSVRSSTSVREQAYSTPIPLSFLASELAGITVDTKVLEPTAGNGMLLVGASVKNSVANELNSNRVAMLRAMGFDAKQENAATSDTLSPAGKVDAVIANPPFGATKDENGNTIVYQIKPGFESREVDHAIAFKALEQMKDDGRAVLIVGGVMSESDDARQEDYRGKNKRTFYYNLYNDYNVTDHFTVDGDLYSKQGASYPVDVIVINGRGKSSRDLPAANLPKIIKSYDALKEKLNEENRMESSRGIPASADGSDAGGRSGDAQIMDRGAVGQGDGTGNQVQSGGSGAVVQDAGSSGNAKPAGGRSVSGGGESKPARASVGVDGNAVSSNGGKAQSGTDGGNAGNGPVELGGTSVVDGQRVESGLSDRRGREQETDNQVAYTPKSSGSSVGTLVPKAMRDAIESSLNRTADSVGDIDQYVAESLDMDLDTVRKNFSAEQIDALALSIRNAVAGKGFIIGDQTGIGKGRVVAAMIRYALVNGKVPIFVTEKPNLYSDMIRDLDDIGMTNDLALDTKKPKILITNGSESVPYALLRTVDGEIVENNLTLKSPKSGKAFDDLMRSMVADNSLGEYKVIFTTYSQLQTVKSKETMRQQFVKHFGASNYMIFDESHNAGGAGETQARTKDQRQAAKDGESLVTGRAAFVRNLVQKAFGTFFSSATYAKRPDVMDLYSSTNMKLAVDRISQLGEAIKSGGVPMQQVVANMLTNDGQYIRRERTFAGVAYDTVETPVDKQSAENMASAMKSILAFSRRKEVVIKERQKEMDREGAMMAAVGGEQSSVQGANFGSIMHNLIDQMLLSLKAQSSVNHAISRLKAGEKVVMTVSNTMGSFLQSYADDLGLSVGDQVSLSFADLYERYLDKQRIVSIKSGSGEKKQHRLTDAELGPELVSMYEAIRKQIGESGFGSAPISPIDFMHSELRKAGYKTDEITGRTVALNYGDNGSVSLASRSSSIKQRVGAVSAFNNGGTDVLILNQAGSTGLSLHASSKVKDKRKRHMIIVQAEKNIDTHMQMLGRVHRTGQVIAPAYSQMMADVPAEMRPASVLLKKMASLNANTTASRKSSVTAEGVVDFMNDYGGQIVHEYLRDNPDVLEAVGGPDVLKLTEDSADATEDDIRKFTGYIPVLPIKQQEEIYRELTERYNDLMERENSLGTNKLEAKAVDLDAETISSVPVTENKDSDSVFATPANMERVDVKRSVKPLSSDEVAALVKDNLGDKTPREFASAQIASISEKAQEFARARIEKMKSDGADPVRIDMTKNQLQAVFSHTNSILSTYKIGDTVSIKDSNGQFLYGAITNIASSGKAANPAAGSVWKMTFALANGDAKSITLNFSQIGSKYEVRQVDMADWYNMETQSAERVSVTSLFDRGANVRREKRWIVTGNILAGFARFPGHIISYTKKDGTNGQGILMNRQFDFEKEMKNAPVVIKTGKDAIAVLDGGGSGAAIGTKDRILRIENRGNRYVVTVPSSKKDGGTYYLDSGITDITGDFYKNGSVMSATTYDGYQVSRLVDYLTNDRQEQVVAVTNPDRAKQILGIDQKAAGNITSTAKLTPADTAIYGMAAEGKSAAEILKFIASASRSPFNRQVAKLLLKTGINPTITAGDGKGWKFNAGEGNKYAAGYDPQKDMISLFRPGASERNMLHEMIHAASLKALSKKGMAAGQMKALFNHVKKTGKLKGMYGMSDIDEFVAEAFTNPKFQERLKQVSSMPVGGKPSSAWNWFIRVIRGILGLKQGQDNALSQALDIGVGVMRENMALKEAPKNYNVRGMADKDTVAGTQAPTSAGDAYKEAAKRITEIKEFQGLRTEFGRAIKDETVKAYADYVEYESRRSDENDPFALLLGSPLEREPVKSFDDWLIAVSNSRESRPKIPQIEQISGGSWTPDHVALIADVIQLRAIIGHSANSIVFDLLPKSVRTNDVAHEDLSSYTMRDEFLDGALYEMRERERDKDGNDKGYSLESTSLSIDKKRNEYGKNTLRYRMIPFGVLAERFEKHPMQLLKLAAESVEYINKNLEAQWWGWNQMVEGIADQQKRTAAAEFAKTPEGRRATFRIVKQNEPSASAGSDDIRYNVADEGWSVSEQAKEMVMRLAGRPMLDPADPFAAENARLREQDQSLWSKAKKQLRRYLAPGGLLPQSVFAEKIKRDSEFQAVEFDVRHLIGGLEQAVKADFGMAFDKLSKEQMRPITEALAGNVPASLPESTKTAAIAMRQYIDGMSTEYLKIIQEKIDAKMLKAMETGKDADKAQAINDIELFEKIKGNIGRYVHRSYQAFDDPKWFEKVPASVLNASRLYLKQGYMEAGETDAKAAQLAEVTLHEILKNGTAYDSMESFIAESKLGAKDLSVLMRRKEVPPQIRALLGEYPDARLNFTKSATKMGRLIWNTRFLDRIRDIGMGAFFFEGKDRPANATTQIAADGSEVYAPLNGLWTFPETAQAFKDALGKEQMSDLYRTIVRANGIVKYGKAQPLDAVVYTPSGPSRMGDLRVGDMVCGINGSTSIEGIYPQGEMGVFRLTFSDGSSTEATGEHLWEVVGTNGMAQKYNGVFTTKEIASWSADALRYASIPLGVAEFDERAVPLDPYLVGAIIGDGSVMGSTVRLSTSDDEMVSLIRDRLPQGHKIERPKSWAACDYCITAATRSDSMRYGNEIMHGIEALGLRGKRSNEKFIPEIYRYNSASVRMDVMRGLLDTDGWVVRDGQPAFCTSSKQLATDFREVAESLGATVLWSEKTPKCNGKEGMLCYMLKLRVPNAPDWFRLGRKKDKATAKKKPVRRMFKSIEHVGTKPCQCIMVNDARHLYLTDRFIVTHNTVLSPTTAMRNWQSAMFFSLANGHFDLTQMKKSIAAFREQVSQKATGGDLKYLRHLKQLGVVYDTPYAGEMARLMEDARMEELLSSDKGDAVRWFRKANQMAQGFYTFGDDFWKIIGFENEKAGLMKAGLTLQEAEVEAAKRIRDTYPTYSMVGRGIQWLSRFPLAGTFVSFPAEIIRTSGNMLRTVASDLKSDNPKLRELGMRRAAGMALVSAAFWSLAAISKAMAGAGDDEEEAIRDLAPEWQKNSTFLYVGRDEKGNLRYFDMSFLDPYGYFKRPITAMMRNQPWEESLASGLRGMLEPFLGTDIAAGAIFEAVANQKDSGGKVYKEKDGAIDQAVDIADHLRKALQPGFVGNAERLVKAATDVRRSSGQPYSVEDELVALVGWRATTTDPKTALYYRSFEFTDAATEARKTITDTLRDANTVTPEDIADAKLRAKAKQEKAFKEMSRLVGAAEAAGMSKMQIVQALRLSNISQSNIAALMQGRTPEVTVTPQVAAQAIRQAMTMRGKEFASEVADRYRTAMKN